MTKNRNTPDSEQQLESWKEISAYLKRDVRTLARWEKEEGLPVRRHKHSKASTVYAYPGELDAWRAARNPASGDEFRRPPWRRLIPAAAGGLALVAVAAVVLWGPIMNPPDPLTEAAEASGVVVKQVWTGPDTDTLGSPSADGRFLSHVHWETGDLAIRDLETGEHRLLTGKGSWSVSGDYAQSSSMSPDGKLVVYSWANWSELGFYELRIAGTDGSEPRVLYRNKEVPYLEPKGWSSDGKQILATFFTENRTTQLALISVEDQSVRVVKTLNWDDGLQASLSPDGRYIVYDLPRDGPQTARDLFLLAADGSREIALVRHPANDRSPIWTPDGDRVVFASNRTRGMSLWAVRVADGRGIGQPVLLRRDMGMDRPMGFTDGGDLFFGAASGQQDVYIASLDLDEGEASPPVRANDRFVGFNRSAEWSPDGRHLAYYSYREQKASAVLSIWSPESGKYRELPVNLSFDSSDVISRPRWSPDGSALAVVATDRRGRRGIYRVNLETSAETPLVRGEPDGRPSHPLWSPDGEKIFFRRTNRREPVQIVMRTVKTGDEKILYRCPNFLALALSPDGRDLAFGEIEEPGKVVLKVMSLAAGSVREIARPESGIFRNTLAWTPDGDRLLFGSWLFDRSKSALWVVSAQGGEPRKLDLDVPKIEGLSMHPDGKRVAFSAGVHDTEVWVMENFLPETRASK